MWVPPFSNPEYAWLRQCIDWKCGRIRTYINKEIIEYIKKVTFRVGIFKRATCYLGILYAPLIYSKHSLNDDHLNSLISGVMFLVNGVVVVLMLIWAWLLMAFRFCHFIQNKYEKESFFLSVPFNIYISTNLLYVYTSVEYSKSNIHFWMMITRMAITL